MKFLNLINGPSARREEMRRLEDRLRREAKAIPTPPTGALHHRVMAGLTTESIVPARGHARPLIALACTALLAAAATGLWLTSPRPVESRLAAPPPPSLPDPGALVLTFPSELVGQVGVPLERESAALKSDLLTASQYLLELTGI